MIRLRDAARLGATKLRTRRIRHTLAAISAGLVFGVIVFASLVVTGLSHSLAHYTSAGYGGRFFVKIESIPNTAEVDDAVSKRAEEIRKARIQSLKKSYPSPEDKQILDSLQKSAPYPSQPDNTEADHEIHPSLSTSAVASRLGVLPHEQVYEGYVQSYLQPLKLNLVSGGKEIGAVSGQPGSPFGGSASNPSVLTLSQALLDPFVMPGQSNATSSDGRVPLFIPQDYAMQLTSSTTTKSMSLTQSLEVKRQARSKLIGQNLDICLRNQTELERYNQAKSQADDKAKNGTSKDYVRPDLEYALPTGPCQPVTILRDVRTAEAKHAAELEQKMSGFPEPRVELVKGRVVGFLPPTPNFADGLSLSAFFTSGPIGSIYLPVEALKASKLLASSYLDTAAAQTTSYFTEVRNASDYKTLTAAACQPDFSTSPNPYSKCHPNGKDWFIAENFGNPSVNLQDLIHKAGSIIVIAISVLIGLAIIILMITIGKIMADSRRETGVFRAIGARRIDITVIYLVYSGLLTLRAYLISVFLASVVALYLSYAYSKTLTAQAADTFGTYENLKQVLLFGLNPVHLAVILGITMVAALLASILPILNNVGRNPIKALRDET